jgi:hypothetical protein
MKKLLVASAMLMALVTQSQARDAMCDLGKNQRNLGSWNAAYHCIDARQARAEAPVVRPERKHPNEFCNLAKYQRNAPSWNEYYHCR